MAEQSNGDNKPITIKKYANRRLYNTSTSTYVTLDNLSEMVKEGVEFVVYDAKSGDDITRQVLTHIIVEEESKGGQTLLPISFLRHLISFYGDSLQTVVPDYLENAMQSFAQNQDQMRSYLNQTMGDLNPLSKFEELNKQNMAMFENAMKMFTPFYNSAAAPQAEAPNDDAPASQKEANGQAGHIDDLRAQLEAMQKQLDGLSKDD